VVAALDLEPGWKPISACAEDNPDRVLTDVRLFKHWPSGTPAVCTGLCDDYGYKLGGVENGTECYCGNGYKSGVLIERPASECSTPCPDTPGVTCGGPFRIQMYGLSP
jgi:hypothetical protein